MPLRVYVDVAFGVNAAVDFLLLLAAARLSGCVIRYGRLLLSAVVGGAFAAGSFLWPFLQTVPVHLAVLVVMLLTAFGNGKSVLRQGALFILVSLALAGLVYLVALLLDWGLVILNGVAYYPVSVPALVVTAGLGYGLLQLALRRCAQHGGGEIKPVTIWVGDRQAQLTALRDTGNTLRDPLTGTGRLLEGTGKAAAGAGTPDGIIAPGLSADAVCPVTPTALAAAYLPGGG